MTDPWINRLVATVKQTDFVICPQCATSFPLRDVLAQLGIDPITVSDEVHRLREAIQRKEESLAIIAHELRNPLAVLENAVSLLRLSQPCAPSARGIADLIERQVAHMTLLADDLYESARMTQGRLNLHLEPLELAKVVERAVELSRPLLGDRRHILMLRLPTTPIHINGDLIRLTQVVTNLLNNAAKYTDEGGSIHIEGESTESTAILRIRDNGRGIPADALPHVFDAFYTRALAHSPFTGLGVGLALAKALVELHGGRIEVRSEGLGHGSEFTVWLPKPSGTP
jgi:signal transduction histidine kinase